MPSLANTYQYHQTTDYYSLFLTGVSLFITARVHYKIVDTHSYLYNKKTPYSIKIFIGDN